MMLLRLLLFLVLIGASLALFRALRPDPRLRIPGPWAAAASRTQWLRDALELRHKIASKVVAGAGAGSQGLLDDVDGVLGRLVEIAEVEQHAGSFDTSNDRLADSLARLRGERDEALSWLAEAYAVLVESAATDLDAAIAQMHEALSHRREELANEVEAQREINATLRS